MAERRRIALEDALDENKELMERVSRLEEEKRAYKEMLDETRALVEVLQVRPESLRMNFEHEIEKCLISTLVSFGNEKIGCYRK